MTAWFIEPITNTTIRRAVGPFPDEVAASEGMDEKDMNDEEWKLVPRPVTDALEGKTIATVSETLTPGAYGYEPSTTLHFTDSTTHTFVHPSEDD